MLDGPEQDPYLYYPVHSTVILVEFEHQTPQALESRL